MSSNLIISFLFVFLSSSLRLRCTGISCSFGKMGKKAIKEDYYKLLGISVDATSQEIKEAYRKLQKKHHPDIAGQRV